MRLNILIIAPILSVLSTASPTENQSTNATIQTVEAAAADNCYWSGTAPFCAGHCPSPYTECTTAKKNCWTGHKSHCCNPSSAC
ncbi:hypothetical protein F5B21DRAFT_506560 [Xylaria acuta]|nr:hypothetical protein F5B21DRAFT_506560 [Xylaria acuta]